MTRTESAIRVSRPRRAKPACNTRTMASAGGPTLKDKKTLLIRWMGYTNYELVYGDKIILLDNGYYNRTGTQYKDLGFTAADITRADLIIIGHGHADHISDTAQVAFQTGAPVIGAPITIAKLRTNPPAVNPQQFITVTGTTGEILNFPDIGITVQPILGLHGQPPEIHSRIRHGVQGCRASADTFRSGSVRRAVGSRQHRPQSDPARRDCLHHHVRHRIPRRLS